MTSKIYKTLEDYHKYIFSKEVRISYYCGNIQVKEIVIPKLSNERSCDEPIILNYAMLEKEQLCNTNDYFRDLFHWFSLLKNKIDKQKFFYFIFGDHISINHPPCLRKVRFACTNTYNPDKLFNQIKSFNRTNLNIEMPSFTEHIENFILLNLNTPRHWEPVFKVKNYDIPFHEKKNKLIWRGSSTGSRHKHVVHLQHHINTNIDIKFSMLFQKFNADDYILSTYFSMKELLECKFVMSMEGNDVASDLKWLLYSNSVVFMCKPTKCSWFMEDCLIPYIHYIPIRDDYTDLEEKFEWAMHHLDVCCEIVKNSTEFIQHFMDERDENEITENVIMRYLEKNNITVIEQ